MINNIKFSLLIIIITVLLSNCSSVEKAIDPKNKNNSEEFLVEKKSPLSMPPSFEELPIPSSEKIDNESQIDNIESLINENNDNKTLEPTESNKEFEELIVDKIKNN